MTALARRARALHVVVGALVCVIVPAGSYAVGGGALAYPMFAATQISELHVRAYDAAGRGRDVSSYALAEAAGGSAGVYLAGIERPRRGPKHAMPRRFLPEIGGLACRVSRAARVEVTLTERARPESRPETTRIDAPCAP